MMYMRCIYGVLARGGKVLFLQGSGVRGLPELSIEHRDLPLGRSSQLVSSYLSAVGREPDP